MFVIDWNLARYLAKTYCVQKCEKIDIKDLIIVALKKKETNPHYLGICRHNCRHRL